MKTVHVEVASPTIGDRVIGCPEVMKSGKWLVEREVPDVPTRVVVKTVPRLSYPSGGPCFVDLPNGWGGHDVTCILGKDELPDEVRDACSKGPWYILPAVLPDFIRARWPEAFK